jgi:hypothetical protein
MNLFRKLTNVIVEKTLSLNARGWLTTALGSFVAFRGYPVMKRQGAPVAMTTTATIASTSILGGLITANQGAAGAATYTLPTGTVFDAACKAHFGTPIQVNDSMDFTIVNISTVAAEDVTVAGDTGMTAVGNMTIASNAAVADQAWGTFRVRKTAANTFSFYRVG